MDPACSQTANQTNQCSYGFLMWERWALSDIIISVVFEPCRKRAANLLYDCSSFRHQSFHSSLLCQKITTVSSRRKDRFPSGVHFRPKSPRLLVWWYVRFLINQHGSYYNDSAFYFLIWRVPLTKCQPYGKLRGVIHKASKYDWTQVFASSRQPVHFEGVACQRTFFGSWLSSLILLCHLMGETQFMLNVCK